jgi:glycosyltransferase involved in cell wall biosynthesis
MNNLRANLCDLVCLSHLRWDFVFQRPQHLMSRFARDRRVFFVEEPVYGNFAKARLAARPCAQTGVRILVPQVPDSMRAEADSLTADMLDDFFRTCQCETPVLWFYTPMWLDAVPRSLKPTAVIYDCMDELSAFKGASEQLKAKEHRLMSAADLVFTGGISLFEAKRPHHKCVHPFPSGVDVAHFATARTAQDEPEDQRSIPRARIGFAGVIDERIDIGLLCDLAALRPDWSFVMLGPVVKIDPATLPQAPNLHWLGMKNYSDLPRYFAHWDAAMMPFAINEATRYISPTKTPEFLAAGLPVVSTPVRDVVRPYGKLGLVRIADTPERFAARMEEAMSYHMGMKWRGRADAFLASMSWDSTWGRMNQLLGDLVNDSSTRHRESRRPAATFEGAFARV